MKTVKMVVTGPYSAGKTAFIRTISEIDVVSTERKVSSSAEMIKKTTTVAMDFGRVTIDKDLVLNIFGTPGQRRFDFMWEILAEGMVGLIVMVDSTRPETFHDARQMLEEFQSYLPVPFIVVANKQDCEDAWSLEDIRNVLKLNGGVQFLPCVATNLESVRSILLVLLAKILTELEMGNVEVIVRTAGSKSGSSHNNKQITKIEGSKS
jgi:small GTP-binding protein